MAYTGLGESVAELDAQRARVLQGLRDVRATIARTTDSTQIARLRQAESAGLSALATLTAAANKADQPALWVRAVNTADAAVRSMGAAVKEISVEIAKAVGETAGGALKPVVPELTPLLWPLAIGAVGVALIMGGGIKLPKMLRGR